MQLTGQSYIKFSLLKDKDLGALVDSRAKREFENLKRGFQFGTVR